MAYCDPLDRTDKVRRDQRLQWVAHSCIDPSSASGTRMYHHAVYCHSYHTGFLEKGSCQRFVYYRDTVSLLSCSKCSKKRRDKDERIWVDLIIIKSNAASFSSLLLHGCISIGEVQWTATILPSPYSLNIQIISSSSPSSWTTCWATLLGSTALLLDCTSVSFSEQIEWAWEKKYLDRRVR
jgi:hypothetical protein